jgi:ATP-binding cassette subfamily B protein
MRERLRILGLSVRLARRAGPWRAALVITALLGVSLTYAAFGFFLKVAADAAGTGHFTKAALAGGGLTAYVVVAEALGRGGYLVRARLDDEIRHLFELELLDLTNSIPSIEAHEHAEFADTLAVVGKNAHMLTGVIWSSFEHLVFLVEATVIGAMLFAVHPVLLGLPLFGVFAVVANGRAERVQQRLMERVAQETRQAEHLFDVGTSATSGKELRVFGLSEAIEDRYDRLTRGVEREQARLQAASVVLQSLGWIAFGVGYAVAILFVVRLAGDGRATVGDVLLTITLAGHVQLSVLRVGALVGNLVGAFANASRVVWLQDFAAARLAAPSDHHVLVPSSLASGITFDHVSFSYPATDVPVLDDVTFAMPAGAVVAFVGENGAGKTTLVKLLCGLYDPTDGAVRADGTDIRRFGPDAWRAQVSGVFQDYQRPELSVLEAVGIGDIARVRDDAAVDTALDRAESKAVVDALPDGLRTLLGKQWEDGVDLSSGQWQRLAIARGFMQDVPLLLVLDEPTAALDPQTEHALFERYAAASKRLARGGITVLVSHRFSTVRMADLIVVVRDGRVAEHGSHAELMRRGGLYAELFELQAGSYR